MFSQLVSLALVSSAAYAKIHDVQVGGANGSLTFTPEAFSADVGDQVVFHFNPKNHTVTQSAFANPCGAKEGGFHSGFQFVAANSSVDSRPTFTVNVTDTEPIWVYCGQAAGTPASHCGQGMVMAVNCGLDGAPNSFANFKAAALAVGASLSAAAASASQTGAASEAPSNTLTAAYGGVTVPPAVSGTLVTVPITLDSTSIWTTTYTSFQNSPAATPVAAAGAVHTVVVGGTGKLFFNPDHIVAAPRDQVVFQFQQKNHSVVQSSFVDPCRPLGSTNASLTGFNSGFHAVGANDTDFPTWSITINDTAPIWAYCAQTAPASHCGAGMVFSVNAMDNTTRSFAAFQALAEQLNGTASASGSGAAATQSSTTGAASSLRATSGAGIALALLAIAASFL